MEIVGLAKWFNLIHQYLIVEPISLIIRGIFAQVKESVIHDVPFRRWELLPEGIEINSGTA